MYIRRIRRVCRSGDSDGKDLDRDSLKIKFWVYHERFYVVCRGDLYSCCTYIYLCYEIIYIFVSRNPFHPPSRDGSYTDHGPSSPPNSTLDHPEIEDRLVVFSSIASGGTGRI